MQNTLAIIKPNIIEANKLCEVFWDIRSAKFAIDDIKYIKSPSLEFVSDFYHEHKNKDFYDRLVNGMANRPWLVLDIHSQEDNLNSIDLWRLAVLKLRPYYSGTEKHDNGLHGSDSLQSYFRERKLVFGYAPEINNTDEFVNLTSTDGSFCKIRKSSIIGVNLTPGCGGSVILQTGESLTYDMVHMLEILKQLKPIKV